MIVHSGKYQTFHRSSPPYDTIQVLEDLPSVDHTYHEVGDATQDSGAASYSVTPSSDKSDTSDTRYTANREHEARRLADDADDETTHTAVSTGINVRISHVEIGDADE